MKNYDYRCCPSVFVPSQSPSLCLSLEMDPSSAQSPGGGSIYPSSIDCTLPYASVSGYAVSSTVPLTQQLYYVPVSQLQPEKPPLPSYHEVREELGEKLRNLNRKQKRKMIKNKRNKQRKTMAGIKEEEQERDETEEVESEEHKRQARLWEERNRMMDVWALRPLDV